MGIEKLFIKRTSGDRDDLVKKEEARGHLEYSNIFDQVERDPAKEMASIKNALEQNPDNEKLDELRAEVASLEAIENAMKEKVD